MARVRQQVYITRGDCSVGLGSLSFGSEMGEILVEVGFWTENEWWSMDRAKGFWSFC